MSASRPLHIRLLGELTLLRGDTALALPPSRRTRALLGYLVASGGPQTRSTLCDLLWDGPDDPRASLRWSLTKLRPLVDDPPLQRLAADRERVSFDPLQCEIDVTRVRELLACGIAEAPVAALEEAAALLRGEFLDGLELPGCYRFHHWSMALREQYGGLRSSVLQALLERLSADPERALPHAHAMVAVDPLSDAAHAALVRLTAAAGRYPDAERHYEWARDLLRREISLPPGGVLDDAIRRVRRDQQTLGNTGVADGSGQQDPSQSSPRAPAPLLGRTSERERITEALSGRAATRFLVFTGEPGIGKSRLLEHFADAATAAGRRVIRGRCFEAEMTRPYGPWLDALQGVHAHGLSEDDLVHAAPLLAGHAAADGNRQRLFQAVCALLDRLARQQPLLLVFDDLQWIDDASAALLHYVARSAESAATLLFGGAARAGELEDNAHAKRLLHSLAREGVLQRHALAPLGAADARVLLDTAEVDVAELDVGDALRQSGGNPLYLLELARASHRRSDAAGRTIEDLIDERLLSLDDTTRDLLGWAAAMGGALRPDLLALAAGLSVAEVLSRLERFEQRGLLRTTAASPIAFAHDLVRRAVYRGLSQPRRQAIHRQFVRVLGEASRDDPRLNGELVHHALLANDALAGARACLAASEHYLRVFANGEAGATADRGLACVDELAPGAERTHLEIGLLGVRVAAAAGPGGRRLPALSERIERAIHAAEALGLHADAGEGWQIHAFWQQQASDTSRTHASTLAAERLTRHADAATHCRQLANSGRCLLDIEADPVRGRALLDEAAVLADQLDLKVMEIEWGRGLVHRGAGRLDDASDALARAVTLARLTANHWREVECLTWLATVELERGCFDRVHQHVEEIVAAAMRMGDDQVPFAQALGALARMRQGEAAAEAALSASLQQLRELDDKAHLAYALNEAALLSLDAGRPQQAAARASEALAAARAVRRPTEVVVALAALARSAPDAAAAAGWLSQAPRDTGSARADAALQAASRQLPTPVPTVAR